MEDKRTVEQIQQEYGSLCAEYGHKLYQITVLTEESEMLRSRLYQLNAEARDLASESKES